MDILTKKIIDNYKDGTKTKLSSIFNNDVRGITYLELIKNLAVNGYEIEFIKANTKDKVNIGIDDFKLEAYSYYVLKKTALLQERDKLKLEKFILSDKIVKLEANNYNKPGQKILDDKETIQRIFEAYTQNWSLDKIANKLNELNIKTKRGGKWYKSTIKYILDNREYVKLGYITELQYNKVQELKEENKYKK